MVLRMPESSEPKPSPSVGSAGLTTTRFIGRRIIALPSAGVGNIAGQFN